MKKALFLSAIFGFIFVFVSILLLINIVKPSPELPFASAQTQPSFEHVIEKDEDEESGDSVLETNIGNFVSEDALNLLEKINSIMNVDVDFENSGDEAFENGFRKSFRKMEKAIYDAEYGDEEFKASMDAVQLPVATIIDNDKSYDMINDLEVNLDDRSVRSSNVLASFWDFGFIFPMQRAFENHVHQRYLDPEQCFLLCETKQGCNAFSVLRGLQSARCDLFHFIDFEKVPKIENKMGFCVDLRPEKQSCEFSELISKLISAQLSLTQLLLSSSSAQFSLAPARLSSAQARLSSAQLNPARLSSPSAKLSKICPQLRYFFFIICNSAQKREMFQFQHNLSVPGLSFKRLKVKDPIACFDKCMRERRCKAFFWREIDKQCSLKNHVYLNKHYNSNISTCNINKYMVRAAIPKWPYSVDFFVTSGVIRFRKENNCPVNVSPVN